MARRNTIGLIVLIISCSIGCGSKHERAMGRMISQMKQWNDVVDPLKTTDDLERAKSSIKAVSLRLYRSVQDVCNLESPSKDQWDAMEKKYDEKMKKERRRMRQIFTRFRGDRKLNRKLFRSIGNFRPGLVLATPTPTKEMLDRERKMKANSKGFSPGRGKGKRKGKRKRPTSETT